MSQVLPVRPLCRTGQARALQTLPSVFTVESSQDPWLPMECRQPSVLRARLILPQALSLLWGLRGLTSDCTMHATVLCRTRRRRESMTECKAHTHLSHTLDYNREEKTGGVEFFCFCFCFLIWLVVLVKLCRAVAAGILDCC